MKANQIYSAEAVTWLPEGSQTDADGHRDLRSVEGNKVHFLAL